MWSKMSMINAFWIINNRLIVRPLLQKGSVSERAQSGILSWTVKLQNQLYIRQQRSFRCCSFCCEIKLAVYGELCHLNWYHTHWRPYNVETWTLSGRGRKQYMRKERLARIRLFPVRPGFIFLAYKMVGIMIKWVNMMRNMMRPREYLFFFLWERCVTFTLLFWYKAM